MPLLVADRVDELRDGVLPHEEVCMIRGACGTMEDKGGTADKDVRLSGFHCEGVHETNMRSLTSSTSMLTARVKVEFMESSRK